MEGGATAGFGCAVDGAKGNVEAAGRNVDIGKDKAESASCLLEVGED